MSCGLCAAVESLKHHRGITHTFIAAPVVAGWWWGGVAVASLARVRRRRKLEKMNLDRCAHPVTVATPTIHWSGCI